MLRNCVVYDKEETKERKIRVYAEFCRSFEINFERALKKYAMKIVKNTQLCLNLSDALVNQLSRINLNLKLIFIGLKNIE